MCESIVAVAEEHAMGRRVTGLTVRVGVLQRVWKPAFDQCFEIAAAGTVAEGATVDLVVVPVHITCRACHHASDPDELPVVCKACGSTELDVSGGDELMLESLVVEQTPAEAS